MKRDVRTVERVLKALANKRRIAIVLYLHSVSCANVGDIKEHLRISFPATSRHLTILAAADIVEREHISVEMRYSLRKPQSMFVKYLTIA